jgi:peptidoglycan/LPS O-acetylase OafA/YrhL
VRERFGDADGLRALAILAVVFFEAVHLAAPQRLLVHPAFARLAADASQGLTLFFVLSGFTLAYPALAATRQDGRAYLDVGRYAIKRLFRIYPAYLALLALTLILPDLALRYGLPALASDAGPFSAHTFEQNAVFAGDGLGNDGFRALGIVARWYLAFPLLLLLWTRGPWIFAGLGLLALLVDFTTPAHAWSLGALVPFMLGIVAAEIRVQHHRFERFGLLFALGAGVVAVVLEPFLRFLPGPQAFPGALRVDPFWAVALFGVVAGAGTFRIVERVLSLSVLRILGAASFAISLAVVPATSFAVRHSSSAFGPLAGALNAGALALVVGYVVWQVADRWFAEGTLRRDIAELLGPWVDRALHLVRADRVVLGAPPPPAEPEKADEKVLADFYAPPPRALPADLAVVSKKSGTAEELAAEILETKKRLSVRSAQILSEPRAEDGFEKPGFYRKPAHANGAPHEPTVDMRRLPRANAEFQPIDFSRLTPPTVPTPPDIPEPVAVVPETVAPPAAPLEAQLPAEPDPPASPAATPPAATPPVARASPPGLPRQPIRLRIAPAGSAPKPRNDPSK